MRVFMLANEKGGVGKTTLAIHLASGLAIKGLRVLLIDADAQGHATYGLGLKNAPGFYDLLVRNVSWKKALKGLLPEAYEPETEKAKGVLFVLPGNNETALIASKIGDALVLDRRLKELEDFVDVVIIDTATSPSMLHTTIYLATDAVLCPTTCEAYSLQALSSTIDVIDRSKNLRAEAMKKPIEMIGIVPMMYRGETAEQSQHLKNLQKRYRDYVWDALPQRITWSEATNRQRPVFTHAPDSPAAREAWSIVERVMSHV